MAAYLVLVLLHLAFGFGADGFNTKLKQKSNQLHAGMTFQEVTNYLAEFEVLDLTNYPAPERRGWSISAKHDLVERVFTNNPTSTFIMVASPRRGWDWGWRDSCAIHFDAQGVIVGYTWMYPN